MTRSELLQIGINLSTAGMQEPNETNFFHGNANEDIRALNALALELFLAEQKRAVDCGVCNIEKIKGLMLDREFRFCPYCGRDLTEGETV